MSKRSSSLCLVLNESRKRHKKAAQDHYGVLKIPKSATFKEVRQAYIKRALETHPDKLVNRLGRPPTEAERRQAGALYTKVVEAFELLINPEERSIYDALLGEPSGVVSSEPPEEETEHEVDARLLQHRYLSEREEISMDQPTKTLICLYDLLTGKDDRPAAEVPERGKPAERPEAKNKKKENLDPCLFSRPRGYEVEISWSNLRIATPVTPSLSQAVSWRAALTALRHTAQRRLVKSKADAAERPVAPAVLESEVLDVLKMQPDIKLTFRFMVPAGKVKVDPAGENFKMASRSRVTIYTPRLKFAEDMRDDMMQVQTKGQLDELVSKCKAKVAAEKKQAKQYFEDLVGTIERTLHSRLLSVEAAAPAAPPAPSPAAVVPGLAGSQRLCMAMGLNDASAVDRAISTLVEVPIKERNRRLKVLLAKPKALPAPAVAVQPVEPRPLRTTRQKWKCEVMPRESMALIVSFLPFFGLASCRSGSKGLLSVSHEVLWHRCQTLSIPMDPETLGGFRQRRSGRIYYKTSAKDVSIRFLQQPKVLRSVETLNLEGMQGMEVVDDLYECLNAMPHLQLVVLPAIGWRDQRSLQRVKRLLKERNIGHRVAKIRC